MFEVPSVTRQGQISADKQPSRWLHRYIVLVALTIWVLIFSGGLVTSKGVGLSVPDWPTTYGYNMFAFPISRWVGGIFYEHAHRLLASGVGFLTIGLTIWLWKNESRRWIRWLGVAALAAVVLQGVLGGLRVVWLKDQIGIFHACLAQAFLALVSFLALATSGTWKKWNPDDIPAARQSLARRIGWIVAAVTLLIYTQLALGASMRHAHAGLSIRDFPTAYGKWWPSTDLATVAAINHERTESMGLVATSAGQILLQMFHRIGATFVFIGVIVVAVQTLKSSRWLPPSLRRLALAGLPIIAMQIMLGIYTIWKNKAADIATMHVAVGAASLVWGVLTTAGMMRWSRSRSVGRGLQRQAAPHHEHLSLAEAAV